MERPNAVTSQGSRRGSNNSALAFTKDERGRTPLHEAAVFGHSDVADLLLANQADVNANDKYGWTPLDYAVRFGNKDVAGLLQEHGGRAEKGGIFGAALDGDLAGLKALLEGNPDLAFSKDSEDDTRLHEAARNGRYEVAQLLLGSQAAVNARDTLGWTPLFLAAEGGHKSVVEHPSITDTWTLDGS